MQLTLNNNIWATLVSSHTATRFKLHQPALFNLSAVVAPEVTLSMSLSATGQRSSAANFTRRLFLGFRARAHATRARASAGAHTCTHTHTCTRARAALARSRVNLRHLQRSARVAIITAPLRVAARIAVRLLSDVGDVGTCRGVLGMRG